MWKLIGWMAAAALFGVAWLLWACAKPANAETAPASATKSAVSGATTPVVVELFTSQGCSSCPPADRVLSELANDDDFTNVYPLSFHVDYWNYIGWKDPFSNKRWSTRQRKYASARNSTRVYTPQAIVGGRFDCVGSRRGCLKTAVAKQRRGGARGTVEIKSSRIVEDGAAIRVELTASVNKAPGATGLLVATHSSGLSTAVPRGENRGRTLRNDYVVRDLTAAALVNAGDTPKFAKTIRVPLKSSWGRQNLGVTAFLQDADTMEIIGAARAIVSGSLLGATEDL